MKCLNKITKYLAYKGGKNATRKEEEDEDRLLLLSLVKES
jgi:hypothetical protein